ncbi:MAG: flagellar filament capping protein FliD [Actinomycetota bacterium]|nr:flagellar filament capping protein FliD [Actinomycetota bacterium]
MSSGVTISGAVSGLDTAGIIEQLVAVQRNQQTILRSQQSAVQKRADAYASLVTSLNSLGTLSADLAKTSAWTGSSATSSSSSVTATATGTATSSISFDVVSLAAAHSVGSTSGVISTSAVVAGSGSITLTKGSSSTSISVGTGSLSEVVSAINNSGNGLHAAAVKTNDGLYRLQVTSATTGEASTFSLSGLTGFTGTGILTDGSDATIRVGGGAGSTTSYDLTSTTNTFADTVPGLSFTVGKVENGVTVGTKIDGTAVADKVSKLVSAANSILSDITSKTTYDTKTKTAGVFSGESTVRSLQQNILSTVSGTGAPGIHLTRDGKITFDQAEFLKAFEASPAAVAEKFGHDSTFNSSVGVASTNVTVTNALKTARGGTYGITVTQAATAEQWQISSGAGTFASRTVALTRGSTNITYTATPADTADTIATQVNQLSAAAGLGITATAALTGTTLTFAAAGVGSATAFTATLDSTAGTRIVAGSDIEGMIDGEAGTGLGTVLSLPSGTSGAIGLSLDIHTTSADLVASGGSIGSLTFTPGLAQRLSTLVSDATASATGGVTTAQQTARTEIKRFDQAIDGWDARLTNYRESLTRQFTAMETALAKLKSSTSALSGLIKTTSSDSES